MENKEPYQYLTIPLPVIQRIYTHPKTAMDDIIDVGVYKSASYSSIDIDNALQQLMYCYYRQKDALTDELRGLLDTLVDEGEILLDEDYNGFDGDNFHIEREDIEGLYDVINNDDSIKEQITIWHQVRQIGDIVGVWFKGRGVPNLIDRAEKVLKQLPECKTLITVKTAMMFEYRNNKKSAFEIDLLVCYLAIRSIIGIKTHGYTTKKAVLTRMIGCNSLDEKDNLELKGILKNKSLKAIYDKYSSISRLDKLLNTLVQWKFITKIGMKELRRTYFSTKLNLQELKEAALNDLLKTPARKIAENTKAEQEAAKRILEALKNQKA